ncbi:uncharacterized protein B0I36DRAFT_408341 [Microdochium trichocladiopsis]|uniref:Uncharacterized protein n=1 Tax=Microdochium trichocladiopsis TaxID=1682393 RepID=A0A9P9BSE8_9PEZI|nr:uncharacterized protein B0I36DRAFT_408341 [Microdochium trichocladiopsis]KAH7033658.1 hypothetical protein B0I36DRAFT_408341 [Microdochium trichocladiopsis]
MAWKLRAVQQAGLCDPGQPTWTMAGSRDKTHFSSERRRSMDFSAAQRPGASASIHVDACHNAREAADFEMLRNFIGPVLMPLAIADQDRNLPDLLEYGDIYLNDSATEEGPLKYGISLQTASFMTTAHLNILRLADMCMSEHASHATRCTNTPMDRNAYRKALYIWDALDMIFDQRRDVQFYEKVWLGLWGHFTPWEFLQVKALLKCQVTVILRKLAQDSAAVTEYRCRSLIMYILQNTYLVREEFEDDDFADTLVSSTAWTFRRDGLLPVMSGLCTRQIHNYLHGRKSPQDFAQYLFEALLIDQEYTRQQLSRILNHSPLGPWSTKLQAWEDPLIGVNAMCPPETLARFKCSTDAPGPRDLWFWRCIANSVYIAWNETFAELATQWQREYPGDIPDAYWFWTREEWDQHPTLRLPTLTEMMQHLEVSEEIAKST